MVTWDDFEKIWASTSPLTPYEFSNPNYSQGWNFVGSTPPARQMWDSIQKKNDEKFKFLRDNFGTPHIVTQASDMTDTDMVYVYMGSEAGWNSGHWYYYNEGTSSWEDGGVYNSVAFVTDPTLSIAGQPADAKAVGDALALKADLAGCTFTGNVNVSADLSVTGTSTLAGDVTASSDLSVAGDSALTNLSVSGTTALVGTSTAPTPSADDNSTKIATTEFVNAKAGNYLPLSGGTVTGDVDITGDLSVSGETSVPTANAGNSSKAIANTEFVAKSIASLVNGAPDQLNTLNELAEALGNDANFSATITAELAKKLNSTEAESTYLPLSGGTLTGVVNGVTPPNGDNSKKLATTEFVNAKAGNYLPFNGLVVALIDGTAAGFKRAMKAYMQLHGLTDSSTAADITTQVTAFYDLLQKSFRWDGYVTFADPAVSSASTGTKGGDNEGLVCVPSTAEVAGQDDYAGLPLFACVDCNWVIDATGTYPVVQITAIDGVVGNFKRYDPDTFVGVLQMTGYHYYTNPHEVGNLTYLDGYRIGPDASKPHCAPMPEAVLPDGTVRSWMIHGKYAAGLKDRKYTCCSGIVEAGQQSHNSSHTYAAAVGTGYAAMCSCDLGFLQLMVRIKYASLTLDNILALANNYSISAVAQVAETGVKRVIIPSSQKGSLIVGSQIQVGNASSTDPQNSNTYAISGKDGWTITAIEDVTIGDTAYAAVYVDAPATFDTGAGNSDAALNTGLHTILWKTGTTDHVKGNDGAIECLSGKYPIKIQGIEFGLGACEIPGDTIFKLYKDDSGSYWYEPHVCKTASKLSTTITSDYHSSGVRFNQAMPEGYIKTQKWGSDGVMLPVETGGSSSTYARDYVWHNEDTDKAEREWLAFGYLSTGVPDGGLSCVSGRGGLVASWWAGASRLSPNGSRG